MHIKRQTSMELVLEDGSIWISLVCAPIGVIFCANSLTKHEPKMLLGAAFSFLFAALFLRHTTFTLDGMQRMGHWRQRTFLKVETGDVAFDAITDIVLDAQTGSHNTMTYRLVILTADAKIPMASVYESGLERYEKMRGQILEFVKPGAAVTTPSAQPGALSDGIADHLRATLQLMLSQGRKIDAVALLRSEEQMSLADAMDRVNAFDEALKATK